MAINKISATTIQKLRDKSVEKLPTVVKNVTPTDLKKKFTGIVVDDKDSIVEEINRIVDETNELVLTLKNDVEIRMSLLDIKGDIENGIIIPLKAKQDEEGNNIIQFYAKKADIEMHEQNTNNPHSVTKEQIGLSNVDNTADIDKPISNATQIALSILDNKKLDKSLKGASGGVAELDENGKVLTSQLPSYVDDVLTFDSLSSFPATGENSKIYVAKDTNKIYRWGGASYVEISASLALGETSSTAHRGDHGKIAYEHSQETGNPHNTKAIDVKTNDGSNVETKLNDLKTEITDLKTNLNNNNLKTIKVENELENLQKSFSMINVNQNPKQTISGSEIINLPPNTAQAPIDLVVRGKSEVIITDEVLEIASWKIDEELKNEIITDEYGQRRLVENVGYYVPSRNDYRWVEYVYTNTVMYAIKLPSNAIPWSPNGTVISNKLPYITHYRDEPHFFFHDATMYVYVNKNELSTFDINGWEEWLLINNFSITYELAVKNPKSKVIQDVDVTIAPASNVDYIVIDKPYDYLGYGNLDASKNHVKLEGYDTIPEWVNIDDVSYVNRLSTLNNSTKLLLIVTKGSHTLTTARNLLRGKTLTYELATPRLAQTEGIASVVNPIIESKSLEGNSTKLQIAGTYNSIPATDIKDRIYNDNGVYYDEINIKKIVVEETTNDGTNYFIDYPSDYKQNGNIFVENIKLTDDGTKLLYPMKYGNPIGKEMIYQLAEPIVKQSEVVGNLISYPNGIIYTHKKVYDVSIYNDEITILNTNLPIQTITKLVKIDFETGLETELNKSLAIIDENGLSFTHPNLINNDIVYFEYEYNQKLTSYPDLDITYLDNRYVLEDEDNPNTFYKVVRKVKSGVLIEELELIE